jgi:hypothetical protein
MRFLILILLFCGGVLSASFSAADIYRWRDAQGKLHYSDKKPAADAEDITRAVSKQNIDTSTAEHQKVEQILRRENSADRQYLNEQRQQQATRQAQSCAALRQRIKRISGRVQFVDDDGKEVHVSEAERNARLLELNNYLKRECE